MIAFTAAIELQLSQFLLQKLPLARSFIFRELHTGPRLASPLPVFYRMLNCLEVTMKRA
jgi:hypothetical protein